MTMWQPIETCPKGEYVLVYRGRLAPTAVTRKMIALRNGRDRFWPENLTGMGAPTHWMPLPDDPVYSEASSETPTVGNLSG
jgi:hypothetical protein